MEEWDTHISNDHVRGEVLDLVILPIEKPQSCHDGLGLVDEELSIEDEGFPIKFLDILEDGKASNRG